MNYLDLSISEIHEAILSHKVEPKDLVIEAIRRAKLDDNNAFEYISEKEALEQVSNLDEKKRNNLLFGIPFVLKDNFATKDIPTTASSNILNNYVPIFSSEVYSRLINEGAILIGKTTLDELAMGGSGTTGHKGISYNPFDKEHNHLIGGSSCGSAIGVCNLIAPIGIGSDTGDSIRKPASYGGLVGLKPTWGRISRYGLFPFAVSLDHVGFFTRNVKDSAIVLNTLAGHDDKDNTSSFNKVDDYTKNLDLPIKNKRIAVISGIYKSIKDSDILKQFDEVINRLKQQEVNIDFVDIDESLLLAIFPTYIIISCAEATSNNANLDGIKFGERKNGQTYEEVITNTRTVGFSELIRRRFVIGGYSLLKENRNVLFTRAQKCRRLIVDAFNKVLSSYDAILLPASPTTAPLVNGHSLDKLSDEYLIADNFMAFANFGGQPSITIPLGMKDGLPFGVNLTAKIFDEANLLNIANEIEKLTGFKGLNAKGIK